MKLRFPASLLIVSLLGLPHAFAEEQDAARAARERGITAPFEQILAAARAAVPARTDLLDATLLSNGNRPMVEVFLRERNGGRVVSVIVDGRAAEVVSVSGRAPGPDPWAGARTPDRPGREAGSQPAGDRRDRAGEGRDRGERAGPPDRGPDGRGGGDRGGEEGRGGNGGRGGEGGRGGDGGRGGEGGRGGDGGRGGGGPGGGQP